MDKRVERTPFHAVARLRGLASQEDKVALKSRRMGSTVCCCTVGTHTLDMAIQEDAFHSDNDALTKRYKPPYTIDCTNIRPYTLHTPKVLMMRDTIFNAAGRRSRHFTLTTPRTDFHPHHNTSRAIDLAVSISRWDTAIPSRFGVGYCGYPFGYSSLSSLKTGASEIKIN
jgi:hypothetical protein